MLFFAPVIVSLFVVGSAAAQEAEDTVNYPLQRSLRFSEEPKDETQPENPQITEGAETATEITADTTKGTAEPPSRDSQTIRADKTWYLALGLGQAAFGPYIDPDLRLEVFYDARRFEQNTNTPRTDEFLGLQLRQFVSNSVFLGYGVGVFRRQQVVRYQLYKNPINDDILHRFVYADSKGSFLSLRLGNEWHWEKWLVAIDWLRINWTLTEETRLENSQHDRLPRDDRHWVAVTWLGLAVGVSL
jgi:hypothetical protein